MNEDTITAHHEAGHAVACILLGAEFSFIEVGNSSDYAGYMRRDAFQVGGELSGAWVGIEAEVIISLAGPIAEGRIDCEGWGEATEGLAWPSADGDMDSVWALLERAGYGEADLNRLIGATIDLLAPQWPIIEQIAAELATRRWMDYRDVRAFMS